MQITKNFSLKELIKSDYAFRNQIDNNPDAETIENLTAVTENILQPVRDHFGAPVIVTSGYRCPELNSGIGGSKNSQHMRGEAVDFEVIGYSNEEIINWIRNNLDYDQLLNEFPPGGWVHCSFKKDGNNRKQYKVIS